MKKQLPCQRCQTLLSNDEIALNLKLHGRQCGTFFCLHCLAHLHNTTHAALTQMISTFKESGCELFSRNYLG